LTRLVACAVVRDDPPAIFAADDIETLNWVLALKLVATTSASTVSDSLRDSLRSALLEERWGDAVETWMRHNNVVVDVYPAMDFYLPEDIELASVEMQFTPLFNEY